jgi:hypothetical protein
MNIPFLNIQFVAVYNRNLSVRERVFEYEKGLNKFFKQPFRTIPIPDSEEPSFPRFEAISEKDNLSVSQERLSFSSFLMGLTDSKKVKEIIDNRIESLKPLVRKEGIQFIGLIIDLISYYEKTEEIFEIIKENTKATASMLPDLVEFSLFYATPLRDKFFLNINNQKVEEKKIIIKNGIQHNDPEIKYGLKQTIDLNSRYSFNQGKVFDEKTFEELSEIAFNMINEKSIEDFLSGRIK